MHLTNNGWPWGAGRDMEGITKSDIQRGGRGEIGSLDSAGDFFYCHYDTCLLIQ